MIDPTASMLGTFALMAVGGYGRGEIARLYDVAIGFLEPWKQTPGGEKVIESILYALWDLGLKIGHSSRSLDEMVRQAKADVTVRTALLDGRYVWGDEALYADAAKRFHDDVRHGTDRPLPHHLLRRADQRHVRLRARPHLGPLHGGRVQATRQHRGRRVARQAARVVRRHRLGEDVQPRGPGPHRAASEGTRRYEKFRRL